MQNYRTRHLTARDNRLVDLLATLPRYSKLVALLRPTPPKPGKADAPETVSKPKPSGR